MKSEYIVVFVPSDGEIDIDSGVNTRSVSFSADKYIEDKEKVADKANKVAINSGKIDPYAVRNDYWVVAGYEYVVHKWKNLSEFSEMVRDNFDISTIRKRHSKNFEAVDIRFDSYKELVEFDKEIQNQYGGKIPIAVNKVNTRVYLRKRSGINVTTNQISRIMPMI